MPTNRPILLSVARAAGVSLKTASRALNGEPYVAAATRLRVEAAAHELGFHRNAAAADLARGGPSQLVGYVMGHLDDRHLAAVGTGALRELQANDLQLLVTSSDGSATRERDLVVELLERRVRAIVLAPTSPDSARAAVELAGAVPLVYVGLTQTGEVEIDGVALDHSDGMRQALDHLCGAGHRRLALVGDEPHPLGAGLAAAFDQASGPDVEPTRAPGRDALTVQAAVHALLAGPRPPTALLTVSTAATLGALGALHAAGATDRVEVVAFADLDLAEILGVSVVTSDAVGLGREAVRLALTRADDPTLAPRHVRSPMALVVAPGVRRVGSGGR